MPKVASLSVVLLCYNDAHSIRGLVERAQAAAELHAEEYEIIVVDDGSTDDSPRVLGGLLGRIDNLRIVRHPSNLGYGGALRSGLLESRKAFVFYTDGDGQYDVHDLGSLVASAGAADVVNGYKARRSDPAHRVVIGKLYARVARGLFNLPIRDVNCDFRLIRRWALEGLTLEEEGGSVCIELVHKLATRGCRFAEVEVAHHRREFGRSQFFRPGRVWRTVKGVWRLWMALGAGRRGPQGTRPTAPGPGV